MSIARHVSRAMLSRYSHVRMEGKRHALDEIAARQCAADEKRQKEAEQQQQQQAAAVCNQSALVQKSPHGGRERVMIAHVAGLSEVALRPVRMSGSGSE